MKPTPERLTTAMQKANFSLQDLAQYTGLPEEKIQAYLDDTHDLGMGEAVKLGRALHVKWTWLMGYGEDGDSLPLRPRY